MNSNASQPVDKWLVAYGAIMAGVVGYLWYRRSFGKKQPRNSNLMPPTPSLAKGYTSQPIYRICITGGPCAGKTSCMGHLTKWFKAKGYNVFCVPEAATFTVHGGGSIDGNNMGLESRLEMERLLMRIQLAMEEYFLKLASMSDVPALLLCDRGVMDATAYITAEERNAIFDQEQWKTVKLRDQRYDLVLHLVTAADGAERYYTTANNQARSEGIELARELDLKTMAVYSAHPHFHAVPNVKNRTFQEKINRCIYAIEDYIKPSSSTLVKKRFFVSEVEYPAWLVKETFGMKVNFLKKGENIKEDRLVRRGNEDSNIYIRWTKKAEGALQYYTERRLTGEQYIAILAAEADPDYIQIEFRRTAFVFQKQQFTVDDIEIEGQALQVLSFFCRGQYLTLVKLPHFMQIDRDISEDVEATLQNLCRKQQKPEEQPLSTSSEENSKLD